MTAARAPGSVQSVERAFFLLEQMADSEDLSLTELSRLIDLPAPTTHRLLQTMVALGYVRQLPNRRYGLGLGLVRLGGRADKHFGPIARPYLELLVQETGESANLAVLDGHMVVYVAQAPSPHPMRMFTELGHRAFTHSTGVGKAILSSLPEERVLSITGRAGMPAATGRTITDPEQLLHELRLVRTRGHAVDDEEQEPGVRCYAVAVPYQPVPMALSVSGPRFRMTEALGARAVPLLQAQAAELARGLAGSSPG